MEPRIFCVTLGFAHPLTINESLEYFYKTKTLSTLKHIIIDQHFPLPSEAECTENLLSLCEKYGCTYINPGHNLGLAGGFNFAIKECGMRPGDILIAYDPDVRPETHGWDSAIASVLADNFDVGWVSLANDISQVELESRGYETRLKNGVTLMLTKCAVINSICAWRVSWLESIGGIREPNRFYGGLESMMFPLLQSHKLKWAFIREYRELRTSATQPGYDPLYHEYKVAHAHTGEWKGDFKSYLEFRRNSPK